LNHLNELDVRDQEKLEVALHHADSLVMKKYLPDLHEYNVVPVADEIKSLNVGSVFRLFKLNRIVFDKQENSLDKLTSVYNAMSGCGATVVTIITSDGHSVDFYIGTRSTEENVQSFANVLSNSLKANFPGSELQSKKSFEVEQLIEQIFKSDSTSQFKPVSSITGLPSIRVSKKEFENSKFIQGIEKLIEAMRGKSYTIVTIADPLKSVQIDQIRSGYEDIYSTIVPYAQAELSLSTNESMALTKTLSEAISEGFNESLSKTTSTSDSVSKSESRTKSKTKGRNLGASIIVLNASGNSSNTNSSSESTSSSHTSSDAEGRSTGRSSNSTQSTGSSDTTTSGSSRSMQLKFENKSIKSLLEKIDSQLIRLDESSDLGMWNSSTYIITNDFSDNLVAANTFQALMRGEDSSVEHSAVNTWYSTSEDISKNRNLMHVTEYLKKMHHPQIDIRMTDVGIPYVTPTSLISSSELSIAMSLPQKSVPGLPVIEYASFGRDVHRHDRQATSSGALHVGNIFHMGEVEEGQEVSLELQSLASHTFITGSTGSGKSNAVYKMLTGLAHSNIKFLVVEAAKGEYKHVFGSSSIIKTNVFGTNPEYTPLLKINPFKFPKAIHVLEHIDRIVELFNVCWPMYAAMPAILKEAIEGAYRVSGWDLNHNLNEYNNQLFPTFQDLLSELDRVISESSYSDELKSNYRGALLTRVKSMTNGLNGQIFCSHEIDETILFDQNTIVDLSRVGSTETKSLIMGVLVMRLSEYRMAQGGMNQRLKHVTVLEEAHHILKRTSTEQSSEQSNLLGKSVEMLSNAIAEMRTYGEGFIIADQSPGLLDISVIRNTNTKIILRLPDMSDRELVGRAAGLDDMQIHELNRLPTGVAAIYQNDWIFPVLCKFNHVNHQSKMFEYDATKQLDQENVYIQNIIHFLLKDYLKTREYSLTSETELVSQVMASNISTSLKMKLLGVISSKQELTFEMIKKLITQLIVIGNTPKHVNDASNFAEWNQVVLRNLHEAVRLLTPEIKNEVLHCVVSERFEGTVEKDKFYFNWVDFMREGSVVSNESVE
jgi:DNA helicase HerA-like ATPase